MDTNERIKSYYDEMLKSKLEEKGHIYFQDLIEQLKEEAFKKTGDVSIFYHPWITEES